MSAHTADQHFEHLNDLERLLSIVDPYGRLPAVELRPWVEEERLHAYRIHPTYPHGTGPDIGAVALFDARSVAETAIDIELSDSRYIDQGYDTAAFIKAISIAHRRQLTAVNHPDFYALPDRIRLWNLLGELGLAEVVHKFEQVHPPVFPFLGKFRGLVRAAPPPLNGRI